MEFKVYVRRHNANWSLSQLRVTHVMSSALVAGCWGDGEDDDLQEVTRCQATWKMKHVSQFFITNYNFLKSRRLFHRSLCFAASQQPPFDISRNRVILLFKVSCL